MKKLKVEEENLLVISQMAADAIEHRNKMLNRIMHLERETLAPVAWLDSLAEWKVFCQVQIVKYTELIGSLEVE